MTTEKRADRGVAAGQRRIDMAGKARWASRVTVAGAVAFGLLGGISMQASAEEKRAADSEAEALFEAAPDATAVEPEAKAAGELSSAPQAVEAVSFSVLPGENLIEAPDFAEPDTTDARLPNGGLSEVNGDPIVGRKDGSDRLAALDEATGVGSAGDQLPGGAGSLEGTPLDTGIGRGSDVIGTGSAHAEPPTVDGIGSTNPDGSQNVSDTGTAMGYEQVAGVSQQVDESTTQLSGNNHELVGQYIEALSDAAIVRDSKKNTLKQFDEKKHQEDAARKAAEEKAAKEERKAKTQLKVIPVGQMCVDECGPRTFTTHDAAEAVEAHELKVDSVIQTDPTSDGDGGIDESTSPQDNGGCGEEVLCAEPSSAPSYTEEDPRPEGGVQPEFAGGDSPQ